ncbi:hypothetical protein JW911_02540 [Candidatus Peregrinibacteria bacterium]|nr:hypothetical protein [Candidatus Peregrinibacteria bacterium]
MAKPSLTKTLSNLDKKRILNFLEKVTRDIAALKRKETKDKKNVYINSLKEEANLLNYFRRFVSPRKVVGKVIDKAKNKFYYETEYFIGEIVARQERFNQKVIKYLEKLEAEIKSLKKK